MWSEVFSTTLRTSIWNNSQAVIPYFTFLCSFSGFSSTYCDSPAVYTNLHTTPLVSTNPCQDWRLPQHDCQLQFMKDLYSVQNTPFNPEIVDWFVSKLARTGCCSVNLISCSRSCRLILLMQNGSQATIIMSTHSLACSGLISSISPPWIKQYTRAN